MTQRYYPLSEFLKKKFGYRTFRVSLNAGFTCPNRDGLKGKGGCIYCSDTALLIPSHRNGLLIREQLENGMTYLKKRRKAERFVAYFQANTNTYAPVKILEELFIKAIDHPDVVALAISTRPDCVNDDILNLLKDLSRHKYLWLELGLQSSNDVTLRSINRGHTLAEFLSAFERASNRAIPVCAHVILGLPGETNENMLDTARFLAGINVWGLKLHSLHVQKSTKLEEMYRMGLIKAMGIEEYAEAVIEFLEEMPEDTVIHRLCNSTPKRLLVAPAWGADRFGPPAYIRQLQEEKQTYQGARRRAQHRSDA